MVCAVNFSLRSEVCIQAIILSSENPLTVFMAPLPALSKCTLSELKPGPLTDKGIYPLLTTLAFLLSVFNRTSQFHIILRSSNI